MAQIRLFKNNSGSLIGDYLPLSGGTMSGNINMHENDINDVNAINFNINSASAHTHTEGAIHWNDDDKTLNVDTEVTDTSIQVGQETVVRATNKTGVTIANGQVVYVDGAQGNRPTIALASATSNISSESTIGLATHSILNNRTGYITTFGIVREIDTSGISAGSTIYLSETDGEFTVTSPASPYHSIKLGVCLNEHINEGVILARIETGACTHKLHDVNDTPPDTDKMVMLWNSSTSTYIPQIMDMSDVSGTGAYSITSHTHVDYSSTAHIHDGFYVPASGGDFTGHINATESLSAASMSGFVNADAGFVFEVRTDDPATPIQGQAWFRSDL